ncbi:MAG TPA: tRNA preQ1(34) S-adenosylmethionine ribosyltransferase-isomerase QueA [Pyrinomonadaceae bacterium]|jgi:S-adenosylmethionine:tRNA ribosyltransferase-isomerase
MHISEFSYELPDELIAQEPLADRDASRMLVVDRQNKGWTDSAFTSLPTFLRKGDLLVLNNTRVFPARLPGRREGSGGQVEVLLVREVEPLVWEALIRPGHRLKAGAAIIFGDTRVRAEVLDNPGNEIRQLRFDRVESLQQSLDALGQMPLPPYIRRPEGGFVEDRTRYQTVFACERGAIAAPTAGLHFTSSMLEVLRELGVEIVEITLHVGYGTFEPVRVEEIEDHEVRDESFEISPRAASTINEKRQAGGRLVAVGTTTTRALESAADSSGVINATKGRASLTIKPGYSFRAVDSLLTNFHLPRSSLLLLVSAFAGRDLVLNAYRHAVEARYRFYSYGDCMLII